MRRFGWLLLVAAVAALVVLFLRRPSVVPRAESSRGSGSRGLTTLPSGAPTWWTSQVGLPARRVAGRVEMDGQPVPRTPVRLTTDDFSVRDLTLLAVLSDETGHFDFGPVPAAAYHVRAEKPGRVGGDEVIDLRKPDPRPAPDEIVLMLGPCAMRVHGTVRDASGGTIARARVGAATWPNRYLAHAVADDQGGYQVCAPSGPVFVSASADGYGTAVADGWGLEDSRVDFDLRPEIVVVGSVIAEDGSPVVAAQVWVETFGAIPGTMTESDAAGRFRLEGLGTMFSRIFARSGDLIAERMPPERIPGKTVELILQLAPRATLRGRLTEAGAPLGGATVAVVAKNRGPVATAVTRADGRFALAGLPRRKLSLEVEHHKLVTPGQVDLVDVGDLEIEIVTEHLATVSGRLTQGGRPLAHGSVHIHPVQGGGATNLVAAEADGTFRMEGVAPGDQVVGADSWDPPGIAVGQKIHVGTEDVSGIVLELGAGASMAGEVVDGDGAPVPDVKVSASRLTDGDGGQAWTDAGGRFLIKLLAGAGEYGVSVVGRGGRFADPYKPSMVTMPDASSQVTGVRLVFPGGNLTISGRVLRAGAPVAGIDVSARPKSGGRAGAYTDAMGAYTLIGLPAGPSTVEIWLNERLLASRRDVPAGTSGLDIELPPAGSVEGALVGFHEPARVQLSSDLPRARADDVVGSFTLTELVPGTYRVTAMNDHGDSAEAAVTVVADSVAHVTMTSRGLTRVDGLVKSWPDGAPIAGAACRWRLQENFDGPDDLIAADAAGRFSAGMPSAPLRISCWAPDHRSTEARDPIFDLTKQPTAHVEIEILHPKAVLSWVEALPPGRILAIDGSPVSDLTALAQRLLLMQHEPGLPVPVLVERDGTEQTVEVRPAPPRTH